MSKFKVKLNQGQQGNLDTHAIMHGISDQRTVFMDGPKGVGRYLKDGEIFDDCNYFKQYCQPYCSAEDALLELIEDDGSIYDLNSKFPMVFNYTIDAHTHCHKKFSINAMEHCGGKIHSIQITNRSDKNSVSVKFNKSEKAILEIIPSEKQTFNKNEFTIGHIDFINNSSENIKVQVLMSVISDSLS